MVELAAESQATQRVAKELSDLRLLLHVEDAQPQVRQTDAILAAPLS
jgi:hypothetical protein